MFQSNAEYYTVLHIDDAEVVSEFTGYPFLAGIQLSYPNSSNEQLVMNAFYEVMDNLKQIKGVKTKRIANVSHYGYDKKAKEMDAAILEKHEIYFKGKNIGSGIACTTGTVVQPLSTLQ